MDRELIDGIWKYCLPKEFKEEVKKIYLNAVEHHPCGYNHKTDLLKYLFGYHNLTSDADGEEMLYVSSKQIDLLQGEIFKAIMDAHDADDWQDAAHYILDVMPMSFAALFGSKCLPDELNEDNFATKKPQPAEPKNEGTHQEQCVPKNAESGTHSFSHILKDDFRDHNRLHIAAMAIQGILSNADWMNKYEYVATEPPCAELAVVVARKALRYADVLIAECKKGGGNA